MVGVDEAGRVDLGALADSLNDSADVSLVSVMAVNNEVGTITDLAEVAAVVRRAAPNAVLHTDAVQAACWLDLRSITPHVDLMSLSAHKFGGPKGVGVLMARGSSGFAPMLVGGGQERERRSGTHNVAGIIGMATALRATDNERVDENARVGVLRDALVDGLCTELDDVHETVDRRSKVAGSAHVCIDGIENEALLYLLDEAGVCASAASSCASGAMEPSHVLAAMGVSNERAPRCVAPDPRPNHHSRRHHTGDDRHRRVRPPATQGTSSVKVLVALSGGVDSSVAAVELIDAGHQVVGITMRLWGGESDTGCCSVADVDDARRVAQQLDIDHLVFNFADDFNTHVVDPYVRAHSEGLTPNPCIECNRHLKFDRLSERADLLGFDAIATGHHARVEAVGDRFFVHRGADATKDQSYVVHMLPPRELRRTLFPVGHLTKAQVRDRAATLGLRTATKPDSQDVCFITQTGGRETFLGDRIPFRKGTVVDSDGTVVGEVPAIEMVTLGQRRGIGLPGGGPKRYVTAIDQKTSTVVVGDESDLDVETLVVDGIAWADRAYTGDVMVQCSAHGTVLPATLCDDTVQWRRPQRRVAPGQSVVFFDPTDRYVLGGGIAR